MTTGAGETKKISEELDSKLGKVTQGLHFKEEKWKICNSKEELSLVFSCKRTNVCEANLFHKLLKDTLALEFSYKMILDMKK